MQRNHSDKIVLPSIEERREAQAFIDAVIQGISEINAGLGLSADEVKGALGLLPQHKLA